MKQATIVVAMGIVSLVGTNRMVLAQCAAADQCSEEICDQRQSDVTRLCKGPARSCTKVSASNKTELRTRLTANQDCLAARLSVQQCFSVTNAGHQTAINEVNNAINTCQNKLKQ